MIGTDSDVMVDAGTAFSVAGVLYVLSAAIATMHVLSNKQNESAAFSWIGLIILSPFFGVLIYWLFGINRIRRRVRAAMGGQKTTPLYERSQGSPALLERLDEPLQSLMRTGCAIHHSDYTTGNQLTPLINGTQAYPRMLSAIDNAQHSVVLSTYIFVYDSVGTQFVQSLIEAHKRGVAVYVLIDGLGVGYDWSLVKADRMLRQQNVPTARFLSTFSAAGTRFINLRNHRKILSVDGHTAFIGGINIRAGNLLDGKKSSQTQDVHFEVKGPIVDQINAVFADDWQFATDKAIQLPTNSLPSAGRVISRVLLDGPDDNYEKLELTLVAAINAATQHIGIVTPYFLPNAKIVNALHLAVLRGVRVDLLVPEKNNLRVVGWAMQANEQNLLRDGIKIHKTAPPFDHSKLFFIDKGWSLIGSSNWDARSLRLNFEINVECYDTEFNAQLRALFKEKQDQSTPLLTAKFGLAKKLRNNFFRLFSPYL